MRQLRWLAFVLSCWPCLYWQPGEWHPLYSGGADWLGLRVWPFWLEWVPTRGRSVLRSEPKPASPMQRAVVCCLAKMTCAFGCGAVPTVTLPRRLGGLSVCEKCWHTVVAEAQQKQRKGLS